LVNYRPEYSHQWNSKTYYTQLRLDPLGQESADEMLSALLSDGKDQIPLKRLIIARTEGNPFFMEETVQVLLDEGALVHDGAVVRLTKPLNTLKIPPTVQGILSARIDRLPPNAKDLLQALAVIGREFPLSLIRAVLTKTDDQLSALLNDLQLREFIYEQPAVGDAEYIFKHALTQEVAYNSVLIERRKQLHERIGAALETLFTSSLDDHLAELANHYGRANNPDKAVQYLTLAGKQALDRSAFAQSQGQLEQGLEWIKALPESGERDASELELASTLAQGFLITKGFTAPETREAAERARVLAEKGGNLAQLVRRIFGIYQGTMASGGYLTAGALADRILYLARRDGSPASLAFAHRAEQSAHYFRGDLIGAEEHFAHLEGFLEAADFRQTPGAVAVAMGTASYSAWTLGYADQARARMAQMIAFDRDSKNPYGLVFARFLESWLYRLMREPQRTAAAAALALAICEEHGFPFLRAQVGILVGWARAQLGSPGEGIALIRQGLADFAELGARLGVTDQLTPLAEAQALDGMLDEALGTIEEALQTNPEELVFRPNVLTCRGELRLKLGQPELAEADFRDAIALAQTMQAKAWELRATMSLARLLGQQGKRDEARTILADIYGWFTEGFDTADLKDAKALLDELST
jgi:tetratricopeptide (TPR) repeat protein